MSMVDPEITAAEKVKRQARIIDALVRRSNRQNEFGTSAYEAFQSAIELQTQVAEKTRDLERASTELERLRDEQEWTRASLNHALDAMEGGFALFANGRLAVCNDLFRSLLPDISSRIEPGLALDAYHALLAESDVLVSTREKAPNLAAQDPDEDLRVRVIELSGDRWYQLNFQATAPHAMVLLATDITALVRQNRSEKETLIDAQATYLQAIFENMTSGVCTFAADDRIMMVNGPFQDLLGLPRQKLAIGASLEDLVEIMSGHGIEPAERLTKLLSWRRDAAEPGTIRERFRNPNGRFLDLRASKLPDGGVLVELTDVTLENRAKETLEKRVAMRTAALTRANEQLTSHYEEQARVEEELRLAKERAEAAVSSKTRFLAAASHDLLQPINAAKLLLATLAETSVNTAFFPSVTRLQRAFSSTEYLLRSLLDISRLDAAEADAIMPTEVCLADMMQGISEDQMAVAEKKGVSLRVVPSSAFVRSDPVYLHRSLQNLVVNAIEYNRPGGQVLVGCRRKGHRVQLQVWDTGQGISPKDQSRIFEEFARADHQQSGAGVGLGLSVVERACRHLGHKLWLRSTPGEGSMFCIEMDVIEPTLPRALPDATVLASRDKPLDLIAMVVENDEDALAATAGLLTQWGADVLAVRSTAEALGHVRDMGMPPDIILADYQLDGADTGVTAIEEIRSLSGLHVPAILITANRSDTLAAAGRHAGFSVMNKPVQVSRLRPLIEWKVRGAAASATRSSTGGAVSTKVESDPPGSGTILTAGRHQT